jgi:hypothetical protein
MDPNLKAIAALLPEAYGRYSVDPRRIYAAGFSGGGQVAYIMGKLTGEVAGVIASGSRFLPRQLEGTDFPIFAAAGDTDFNYLGMRDLDDFVGELGNPHRFELFEGRHTWMPAELASRAVAWLEIEAMRDDLRPRDTQAVARHLDLELEEAQGFENRGELLSALRRYQVIVRTYSGLADTNQAKAALRRLEDDKATRRALKDEKKLRTYEARCRDRFQTAYTELIEESSPLPAPRLRQMMGIAGLEAKAHNTDAEGAVARRLLETAYSETLYYLTQEFFTIERFGHARSALKLAISIFDDRPAPWYNLACAEARLGHDDAAIDALVATIERGFAQTDLIETDSDLDPLRQNSRFQQLLAGLQTD